MTTSVLDPERKCTDCRSLKEYLNDMGPAMQAEVPVHGQVWRLSFRSPEEILCREMHAGLISSGQIASQSRLDELRHVDQYVLSLRAKAGTDDAVATALLDPASGSLEERFALIVHNDTLPCLFAHAEAAGSGPWGSRVLLTFERDSTEAARTLLVRNVPGIEGLTVHMPLNKYVFAHHARVVRPFLPPTSPAES